MTEHTFKAGFLFAGSGFGARGFEEARARVGLHGARFANVGGVDFDAAACKDFERLTNGPSLCADLSTLQPHELRAFMGETAPDVIFSSAPCKAFSQLLSVEKSETPEYKAMAELYLRGLFLAIETWPDSPPGLLIFENVPSIQARGAHLLEQARKMLWGYGYRTDERVFDCGEVGGLAQHRRRHIMVARLPSKVSQEVFVPPKQRVKGCGEVLGPLPLPNDAAAGPLHRLPEVSLLTYLRLAFIPAGGDWRDLPKSAAAFADGRLTTPLKDDQARREVYSRYHVGKWEDTARTVAGSGTNGGFGIADPRVQLAMGHESRRGTMKVMPFDEPADTVRGRADVRTGPAAVADDRLAALQLAQTGANAYKDWKGRPGLMGVTGWDNAAPTVSGKASVTGGNMPAAVADPRLEKLPLGCKGRNGFYGVLGLESPADTVTGSTSIDNGRCAVADEMPSPPVPDCYLFLTVDEALDMLARGEKIPKGRVPVIASPHDGLWHRPLTDLELAVLQGAPAILNGQPLTLSGGSRAMIRTHVGNAVPVGSAAGWAAQFLGALLRSTTETFALSATGHWVSPEEHAAAA